MDNPLAPEGRIDIWFAQFRIFFYLYIVVSISILFHTRFDSAWVITLFVSFPITIFFLWAFARMLYGGNLVVTGNVKLYQKWQ